MANQYKTVSDEERFKIFQLCSGNYLCDTIPDDWESMSEEDQDEFMEENVWQPFEDMPVKEVYSIIDSAASTMVSYIERNYLNKEGK